MSQYIIRRVLSMILVLFLVSLITFIVMRAMPGGPFSREKAVPPQVLAKLEERYHLSDPPHIQYIKYMTAVSVPLITENELPKTIHNDFLINIHIPVIDRTFRWMNFGPSYRSASTTVNDIFKTRLPVSMQLGLVALAVAVVIGVPAGIVAALNRNTRWDYLSMGIAIIGVSVPVIVSGPILRYVFGVALKWLPPTGWGDWQHMIMPAAALGFGGSAILARLTRASLLQVLNEDYIRTARSKGLAERVVVGVHALRNALIPVVTVLGPMFAALITGSFVTELIFGIPGLGQFFVTSITNRDYTIIMGTTLLYAFILVFANLLVDLTYALLDPRIQYT
jgi:oligopeptide transport system permease protein